MANKKIVSVAAVAGVGKVTNAVLIKAGRDWLNSHKKEETKMRKSVTKKSAEKKAGKEVFTGPVLVVRMGHEEEFEQRMDARVFPDGETAFSETININMEEATACGGNKIDVTPKVEYAINNKTLAAGFIIGDDESGLYRNYLVFDAAQDVSTKDELLVMAVIEEGGDYADYAAPVCIMSGNFAEYHITNVNQNGEVIEEGKCIALDSKTTEELSSCLYRLGHMLNLAAPMNLRECFSVAGGIVTGGYVAQRITYFTPKEIKLAKMLDDKKRAAAIEELRDAHNEEKANWLERHWESDIPACLEELGYEPSVTVLVNTRPIAKVYGIKQPTRKYDVIDEHYVTYQDIVKAKKVEKPITKPTTKAKAENLQSAQQYYDSTIGRNPSCRHVEGHGNDQYIAGMQAKVREHFKLKKGEDIPVIYWNANLADGIGLSVKGRPGAIEGSDDERIPGMIQAFRAAPSKQMEEEISDLVRATWHKISGCGAIEVKPSNPLPEAPKVADRGDFVDKEGIKLQMSCDDEALPKVRIGDVVSFVDLAKEPMVLGILVHDSADHWAGVLRGHKIYRVKDTAKVLTITDFKTCCPVTGPAAIAVVELAHSDLLSAHDNPGSKKEAIEELYEEINEKEIKENGLDQLDPQCCNHQVADEDDGPCMLVLY